MDMQTFMLNVLLPIVIVLISTYVARKLMPYDILEKKSDTIKGLFETVETMRLAADKRDKIIADLQGTIETQAEKIKWLEHRDELIVVAEVHVQLSDPPIGEVVHVEYKKISKAEDKVISPHK